MRGTLKAGRWLAIFGLALGLGLAGRSFAQVVIPASTVEFDDAELFKPTVDPGPFLSVYDARTLERGRFSIGSYFSYGLDAMDGRRVVFGEEQNETIVESLVTLNVLGALGLTDRIQLGTHLPLYITDEADVVLGADPRGDTNFNFGDLLLNAKIDLLPSDGRFGLAVVPTIGFPTGNRRDFAGLGSFSYGSLLAADVRGDFWRFGANVGWRIRDGFGDRDDDDDFEDVFPWGLALSRQLGKRWAIIGELYGVTDWDQEFHSPVEMVGAARWNVGPVDLTFGLGGGLNSGKNAATFRFLLGVTAPMAVAPGAARPEGFAGPPTMSGSRKTYVVEDHDRNGQVSPGDVMVYTITITNTGANPARNVLVDPIPADSNYLPGTIRVNGLPVSDAAAYTPVPPQVVVRIPSLTATAGTNLATVVFKVRIRPELANAATVRNEARISADGIERFSLPIVETAVFPAAAQREKVVQTTPMAGARKLEVTENIQFEPAGDTIRAVSYPVLDQVASILQEQSALQVQIVGHTDDVGDEAANLDLSERRADAVKDYLYRKGIASGRMETVGRGEYEPISSNETEAGRAANRRVEFIVKSR